MERKLRASRSANIELLRIFAMLLIVCYHFSSHGMVLTDYDFDDPNRFFNWLLRGIGYIGVNTYIIISAYFLCRSSFKITKFVQLILEVWFYSVFLYAISVVTGNVGFSIKGAFSSFFPILCSQYWFISCYAVVYLLSPFLNKIVNALSDNFYGKPQHNPLVKFTLLLIILFSIIPTIFFFSGWLNFGGTCGIVWMTIMYFAGATLRNVVDIEKLRINKTKVWALALIFWVLPLLTKILIANITNALFGHVIGSSIFYMNNSIIIVCSSIFTFLAFLTIDIKKELASNIVRWVASSTLAVYLIHDNDYVRDLLWHKVMGVVDVQSIYLPITTLITTLSIFIICITIDKFRIFIFSIIGKFIKIDTNRFDKINKWINI